MIGLMVLLVVLCLVILMTRRSKSPTPAYDFEQGDAIVKRMKWRQQQIDELEENLRLMQYRHPEACLTLHTLETEQKRDRITYHVKGIELTNL